MVRQGRLLAIILAGVTLLGLGGCLREPPEQTITLTWWVTYAEESPEYPTFQAIAEAFGKKTGSEVSLVSVPWTDIAPRGYGTTRLAIAQEAGRGPDILGPIPHSWTGGLASGGQLLAMQPAQIQNVSQYPDAALWACQVEQQQVGLPILADAIALIYNKALVPDPPHSFEQLLDIARAHTDAKAGQWGLTLPLLSQYHTYPFIEGYDGYLFRCERGACAFDDVGLNNEGAVQGVQFLADLYLRDKLFPEELADRATMTNRALGLFTEGKAAMLIDGSWAVPAIRESGIRYGVASIPPLPGATRAPRPLAILQVMALGAGSPHPEQAIDLINHVANPENVAALVEVLGKTPVRLDILRSPAFRGNREVVAWAEQIEAGVPLPNIIEMDYIWRPWGQALDEAVPGLTPVQEALDRAVEEYNALFSD